MWNKINKSKAVKSFLYVILVFIIYSMLTNGFNQSMSETLGLNTLIRQENDSLQIVTWLVLGCITILILSKTLYDKLKVRPKIDHKKRQ